MATPYSPTQNHLLGALPAAEFDRLPPHLELVPMPLGEILYESGAICDMSIWQQTQFKLAVKKTSLSDHRCEFADVAQCLYACVQRDARKLLEERGVLPPRETHRNGAEWLFWAEETNSSASR